MHHLINEVVQFIPTLCAVGKACSKGKGRLYPRTDPEGSDEE
jgi:hypothetical protein